MKRILITGGAGFLGSHLVKKLIQHNEIIVVDNFYTGNKKNLQEYLLHPHLEIIRHDITFPVYLEVPAVASLWCCRCGVVAWLWLWL